MLTISTKADLHTALQRLAHFFSQETFENVASEWHVSQSEAKPNIWFVQTQGHRVLFYVYPQSKDTLAIENISLLNDYSTTTMSEIEDAIATLYPNTFHYKTEFDVSDFPF